MTGTWNREFLLIRMRVALAFLLSRYLLRFRERACIVPLCAGLRLLEGNNTEKPAKGQCA